MTVGSKAPTVLHDVVQKMQHFDGERVSEPWSTRREAPSDARRTPLPRRGGQPSLGSVGPPSATRRVGAALSAIALRPSDSLRMRMGGYAPIRAYAALGSEAGEWLQQAALAIRARVPLDILRNTIQQFPMFSEICLGALTALHSKIATAQPVPEVAS